MREARRASERVEACSRTSRSIPTVTPATRSNSLATPLFTLLSAKRRSRVSPAVTLNGYPPTSADVRYVLEDKRPRAHASPKRRSKRSKRSTRSYLAAGGGGKHRTCAVSGPPSRIRPNQFRTVASEMDMMYTCIYRPAAWNEVAQRGPFAFLSLPVINPFSCYCSVYIATLYIVRGGRTPVSGKPQACTLHVLRGAAPALSG